MLFIKLEFCTGNKLPEVLTIFFVSEFNLQSPYSALVQGSLANQTVWFEVIC